ncbi:hypothetical protein PanWU01x14_240950, partial [Parasponia andersonii]
MPLPNNLLAARKHRYVQLAVRNESIAFLVCQPENSAIKSIDVWVMNDHCSGGVK